MSDDPHPAVPYLYCVLQVVPRVERDERFNVGVVLFCRPRRTLLMRTALDRAVLTALASGCDAGAIDDQLTGMRAVADGSPDGGPLARLDLAERFHWLTSPANTIVQPGPVHVGMTTDPAATLDRLFAALVTRR